MDLWLSGFHVFAYVILFALRVFPESLVYESFFSFRIFLYNSSSLNPALISFLSQMLIFSLSFSYLCMFAFTHSLV